MDSLYIRKAASACRRRRRYLYGLIIPLRGLQHFRAVVLHHLDDVLAQSILKDTLRDVIFPLLGLPTYKAPDRTDTTDYDVSPYVDQAGENPVAPHEFQAGENPSLPYEFQTR